MTVQTTVNQYQVLGVVGEFADDSPHRCTPYSCLANDTLQPAVGLVFTQGTNDNEAVVGGSGAYLGVLVEPKQYANFANLNATLNVNPGTNGEICNMGHIFVKSPTAVKPGYVAAYNPATGIISGFETAGDITSGYIRIPAKFIKVSAAANQVSILELGTFETTAQST